MLPTQRKRSAEVAIENEGFEPGCDSSSNVRCLAPAGQPVHKLRRVVHLLVSEAKDRVPLELGRGNSARRTRHRRTYRSTGKGVVSCHYLPSFFLNCSAMISPSV